MIAPGKRADIVLLDDLEDLRCVRSARGRSCCGGRAVCCAPEIEPIGLDSMKAAHVTAEDFRMPGSAAASVIGVIPGKIITEHLRLELPVRAGERQIDLEQDVMKVAVVARHGVNRNIGRGFVKGFGLRRGAIASSVGHDSHNICVVGADDVDMAAAVNRLVAIRGGFVVVSDGEVRAELSLPVAGLMSDRPFEAVRDGLGPLRAAAKALGLRWPNPFCRLPSCPAGDPAFQDYRFRPCGRGPVRACRELMREWAAL